MTELHSDPITPNPKPGNIIIGGQVMEEKSLPYGTFPSLAALGKETFLAYQNANGIEVLNLTTGEIVWLDSTQSAQGFPKLSAINGKLYVAYRIDNPSTIRAVDIFAKVVVDTGLAPNGNFPCAWYKDYLFHEVVGNVLVNQFPFTGIWQNAVGTPAPTGIAYAISPTQYVNCDENRVSIPGQYNPSRYGDAIVGEGISSGFILTIGSKTGNLRVGKTNYNPVVTTADNRNYTIAWWNPVEFDNQFKYLINVTADDIPVELPIEVPAAPSSKQRWCGIYFNKSIRYGDNPETIGNVCLMLDEQYDLSKINQPMIVSLPVGKSSIIRYQDLIIAYYARGGNITDLMTDYNNYIDPSLPEKPIIAYLDSRNWPPIKPNFRVNRTWLGVQLYRNQSEPINNFQNSCEATLNIVSNWNMPILLVTDLYDRSGLLTSREVQEIQYLYNMWYDKYPLVIGELAFSDRRPTGLVTHPEFRPFIAGRFDNQIRPTRNMYWQMDNDWRRALRDSLKSKDTLVKNNSQESQYLVSLINNNLGTS